MTNSVNQIIWFLYKPADLDLHCLQRQGISRFNKTRVKLKVNTNCSWQNFEILFFYFSEQISFVISHELSGWWFTSWSIKLLFSEIYKKKKIRMASAAVLIGTLKVKDLEPVGLKNFQEKHVKICLWGMSGEQSPRSAFPIAFIIKSLHTVQYISIHQSHNWSDSRALDKTFFNM